MKFADILDEYTLKARLYPSLLVSFPVAVTIAMVFPDFMNGTGKILWGIFLYCGGALLLAQIGRDLGKKKEQSLFERWGGKPTDRRLNYSPGNEKSVRNLHERLHRALPHLEFPVPDSLIPHPQLVAETCEECTSFLRQKTRDRKKYPLVFEENCNYGFRRNTWGMKPYGIFFSLLSLVASLAIGGWQYRHAGQEPSTTLWVAIFINSLSAVFWIASVSHVWVRVPSEAYADRVLEAGKEFL